MSSWRKVYGETKKDKRSFSTWLASLLRPKSFDDELWNEFRNAKTDDEIRDVSYPEAKASGLSHAARG